MNFTNSDGLDQTYYDIYFFIGLSKKNNHTINDKNICID